MSACRLQSGPDIIHYFNLVPAQLVQTNQHGAQQYLALQIMADVVSRRWRKYSIVMRQLLRPDLVFRRTPPVGVRGRTARVGVATAISPASGLSAAVPPAAGSSTAMFSGKDETGRVDRQVVGASHQNLRQGAKDGAGLVPYSLARNVTYQPASA